MATKNQLDQLYKSIKDYKKKYLKKEYTELDESATRLMINSLLTDSVGQCLFDIDQSCPKELIQVEKI